MSPTVLTLKPASRQTSATSSSRAIGFPDISPMRISYIFRGRPTVKQLAACRIQTFPGFPEARKVVHLQQLPDSPSNTLLTHLPNCLDDPLGVFCVTAVGFQAVGCLLDEFLLLVRPWRIGCRPFHCGDGQQAFVMGSWFIYARLSTRMALGSAAIRLRACHCLVELAQGRERSVQRSTVRVLPVGILPRAFFCRNLYAFGSWHSRFLTSRHTVSSPPEEPG